MGKDNGELIEEVSKLKKHVQMLTNEATAHNKEKSRLNKIIDTVNEEKAKKDGLIAEHEKKNVDLLDQIQSLTQQMQSAYMAMKEMETKFDELKREVKIKLERVTSLEQNLKREEGRNDELNKFRD